MNVHIMFTMSLCSDKSDGIKRETAAVYNETSNGGLYSVE